VRGRCGFFIARPGPEMWASAKSAAMAIAARVILARSAQTLRFDFIVIIIIQLELADGCRAAPLVQRSI
jgi:hypothetical protein